ncbi:MAG TPA: cysteine--tRNA ligase [Candidatus Paceibacterota bacterium]|nr:cysteine--tRNA ligase [Candidatus Paceibacterota bacterium]
MALEIFNTLSREKEEFAPINPPKVGLYTCGPTVYSYAHIGNWRAYIFADLLKRYLAYRGYDVTHIMNITDVEDKIIREVKAQNKSLKELTQFYTEEFFKDRDALNILPPNTYTKATDYINKMVALIKKLEEKGFAYRTSDGSVYFDIHKDENYGKLSHFKLSDLKENAEGRLKKDEYEKENAQDFALWKVWTPEDGEVYWETELGKGRPGWHIECSVMSMDNLGESFDIHTGGVDNIFPHHENEIAQSECATGKPFAKYFMHNEHLLVDGQKMAKSAGNFYILKDLIEKGIDPLAFRLWLYTSNYSTRTNFTIEAVMGSQTALIRLREAILSLGSAIGSVNKDYKDRFIEYLDNNLDSPKAFTLVWELLKDSSLRDADKKATLLDFDKVLGLNLDKVKEEIIPDEIKKLAEEREQARQAKDWVKSDELRNKINSLGYEVKDTENGFKVSKK